MDQWSEARLRAIETAQAYVVHISALDRKESSLTLGTGVVMDPYHVVTSGQIAGKEDQITVRLHTGRKVPGECLEIDPLTFVAVVRVQERLPVAPPPIVPGAEVRAGVGALAIGYAVGVDHTASFGIVCAGDHTVYRPERFPVDGLILTDAAIHPGNAGGALIDLDGRVLGLNGIPYIQGLSLALRFQVVARVANQIIEYGRATHPWLGFSGQAEIVEPALAQLLELPADRGVVVQHVKPGGPASQAGIEVMDMVVRADGRPALHVGQIRQALALHRPGARVPLTVLRGGELVDLMVAVEDIPNLFGSEV